MLATQLKSLARRMSLAMTRRDLATGLRVQTGAIPWRRGEDGAVEVLLVTGRRSGRWLIPKGWPMLGRTLAAAAAQEAWEEAGVRGRVGRKPVGTFRHGKQHPVLGEIEVAIVVHGLAVERELPGWPERGQRQRQWFSAKEAAAQVQSSALAHLILQLEAHLSTAQLGTGDRLAD